MSEGTGSGEYVRQLEDALLVVWAELPPPASRLLRNEVPEMMDFCAHLHHSVEHEWAMVRRNVWTDGQRPPKEPGWLVPWGDGPPNSERNSALSGGDTPSALVPSGEGTAQ